MSEYVILPRETMERVREALLACFCPAGSPAEEISADASAAIDALTAALQAGEPFERLEHIERMAAQFIDALDRERALNWDDYPEHPTYEEVEAALRSALALTGSEGGE